MQIRRKFLLSEKTAPTGGHTASIKRAKVKTRDHLAVSTHITMTHLNIYYSLNVILDCKYSPVQESISGTDLAVIR